jgi:hypothetical protein
MEAIMPRPAQPHARLGSARLDAANAAKSRSLVRLPVAPRLLSSELPSAVHEQLHENCFGIADDPRDLFSQSGQGCDEIQGGDRLANVAFAVDRYLPYIGLLYFPTF